MTRPLAAALALLIAAAGAAAGEWQLERKNRAADHALSLWSRSVPGSSFPEYRMEVALSAAPDEVIGALEINMFDPRTWPSNFEREVLRRETDLVISYDYIALPMLSDRDVVVRTEIRHNPASGAYLMEWSSTANTGPAPRQGVMRIPRSRGFWRVTPDGEGGSRAVYQSFVELTGRFPRFFIGATMEPSILRQVEWLHRTVNERRLARKR